MKMTLSPTVTDISIFTSLQAALSEGFQIDARASDGYIVTKRVDDGWVLGIVELSNDKENTLRTAKKARSSTSANR